MFRPRVAVGGTAPKIVIMTLPTPVEPAGGGAAAPAEAAEPPLFDALLQPYRSLPPMGFAILMAAIGLVGFLGGVTFLMMGAWPVTGFGILEIGLFYLMFRLNYRSARIAERVVLTASALTIERFDRKGITGRWSLPTYWLQVELAEPTEPDTPLTLRSHGRSLVIGRFLPPSERLDFAKALRAALAAAKG